MLHYKSTPMDNSEIFVIHMHSSTHGRLFNYGTIVNI